MSDFGPSAFESLPALHQASDGSRIVDETPPLDRQDKTPDSTPNTPYALGKGSGCEDESTTATQP